MKIFRIITCGALCTILFCCNKQQVGFLSDRLFYRTNPLVAVKGRVTTSAPLEVDASTQPINVKLLAVRAESNQNIEAITKEYEIPIYKAEIRSTDTTLEMIQAKLGLANYKPFTINPIGGRMEVTPASVYADTGNYVFDINVSNIRGSRAVNNAGKVRLTPPVPFTITRSGSLSTSTPNQEATFTTLAASAITTTVTRIDGPNQIIIKFVDKNDIPFNPSTNEVIPRPTSAGNVLRYHFAQFDPYYPAKKTDTAFVYQYPEKLPAFPLFGLGGTTVFTNFYRIPNTINSLNLNLNPEFGIRFYPFDKPYVTGTYIITNKLNTVTHN